MRKLLLFACALFGFMACTQNPIEEQSAIRTDAPETIRVGFEDDETRIQLNSAQKTVWTKDDLVSVFYRSDANQKWQYQGETGERVGDLKRVDAGTATESTKRVVVVYPYNENYYINTETYNVQASLPAVQHYLANSYGTDGNIMISSSEYNQFSLKSVCGWLKLQLTGDGEVVKSIKFRGNDDEQVAGELYINSADATAMLASDMGGTDDNNAGGNLVFDDTILTEVVLDCGEGVTLGAEVTSFYISLPPQTFENGFTVEIESDGYKPMTLSTENELVIERNTIQPMASVEHNALYKLPNNEIWYTNGSTTEPTNPRLEDAFGVNIISNTFNAERECWVIKFDGEVSTIGYRAFNNCRSLTSITIPDSVTTIEWHAFDYCTSLTSITIPDSVTTIGIHAFYYCSSLTSVTIPDSVTTIGRSAFGFCDSLTSITIPDSVTTIGDKAFVSCGSLMEFRSKFASEDGRCLIVDGILNSFAPAGLTEYTIPNCVTAIGNSAFFGCHSQTSVTIPDSVTSIGDYAFYYCDSLTSVTIPDSVTSIGAEAFHYCSSLTSVTIPDGVTSIEAEAFASCSSLTSVTIPEGVTTIGNYAFCECTSLTSITIPDSVTTIGYGAFEGCSNLTSVTIGDSVTTIGEYAFCFCHSLTNVTIPDSVTTIGGYAFLRCSSLTSVTIPDSVTAIGGYVFCDCGSLTSVYCKAITPPAGDYGMFNGNASGRNIYVPTESVEAYKSAEGWSEYASSIEGYNF